jgi:hypothetical protein
MKYISEVMHSSKLPEFVGVSFVLRKFSHGRRAQLRLELAPAVQQIREITERIQLEVSKYNLEDDTESEGVARSFDHEQLSAINRMQDWGRSIDTITAQKVDPSYLRAALVRVIGLTDPQDNEYNAQTLYETGPEDLCKEIVEACRKIAGFTQKEKEDFELPTTSGAAAGGPTSDISASNANVNTTTPLATAAATSLSE